MLEVVGLLRARMRGRIDASMSREVVEEAIPFLPERTVQINDGRAFALDQHRIRCEAARQLYILFGRGIHAWTFASAMREVVGCASLGWLRVAPCGHHRST